MCVRLGYACINLSLQADKKGPRLRNITAKRLSAMEPQERRSHLYQVARQNLKTLEAVLRWNAEHNIQVFRITSELVPLATHPVAAGWDWAADLAFEFAACAAVARETGVRLSMHPGPYTVLNAPDPTVVAKAGEDLAYHARVLDLLETGPEAGLVLHVGGGYGDKAAAADRFVHHFRALPPAVGQRIWIENDDMTWDTAEALAVALRINRPMVFDVHHHRVLRDDDWLPWLHQALPTWGTIRPKIHYSTPRDGERSRQHADDIDAGEFAQLLRRTEGISFDVMLECKNKDLALLRLRRDLSEAGQRI